MISIKEKIYEYIDHHRNRWADSTLKSERHRLQAMVGGLDGSADTLYGYLKAKGLKPYSIKTTFIRAGKFWQWAYGSNPYAEFMTANAQLFRNAYTRRPAPWFYGQVLEALGKVQDNDVKVVAEFILKTGLRASEVQNFDGRGVVGKGAKYREVYAEEVSLPKVAYDKLRYELSKVGLKPHDLRKAFATRLVELGANEFELTKLMGWSNLNTAQSYVKASPHRLKDLLRGL